MSDQRRNAYICLGCNGVIVTVDRDAGVTPMFLACRATEGCGDRMVSSGYRLPPDSPEPTWEWYTPTPDALRRLKRSAPRMAAHVEKGGLLLRKIA